MKVCCQCSNTETKQQWYKGPLCRDCWKSSYYKDNKVKIKAMTDVYYNANHSVCRDRQKKYNDKNTILNKERVKNWLDLNKRYVRDKQNITYKNREKIDINFKLSNRLRHRVRSAIKNNQKVGSAIKDLGCSIEELKVHLEFKFQSGMTWGNYGEWHIDHIKPLSLFNLEDKEQFNLACHYTNLQPLWRQDNLVKSNKYEEKI